MYKFLTKKEYLDEFREKGKVQIGNIKYYREKENKNKMDAQEGITPHQIFTKDKPVDLSEKQADSLKNEFHIECGLTVGPNSFLKDDLIAHNSFVFCLSTSNSKDLKKRHGNYFYKIKDLKKFAQLLHKEIEKKLPGTFMITRLVDYVPTKTINITNENKDEVFGREKLILCDKNGPDKTIYYIRDYFTKTEEFLMEEEYRIVFVPKGPISDELLYIECPELVDLCEFPEI